jgi:hypothetical protein
MVEFHVDDFKQRDDANGLLGKNLSMFFPSYVKPLNLSGMMNVAQQYICAYGALHEQQHSSIVLKSKSKITAPLIEKLV